MAPTVSPSAPIASDDRFASAIVAGSTSGFHVLRIEGYSGTKFTIPNGQHVESHPFRIAGHTWTIRQTGSSVTTASFMELEQSDRLRNDDCFTVRCDIIVLSEPRAEAARLAAGNSFVKIPPPDWSEHFRELLRGGKGADVRFLVGGETFAAHRCVLAARSPVFGAMLLGPMKEDTTTQNQIQSCIPAALHPCRPQQQLRTHASAAAAPHPCRPQQQVRTHDVRRNQPATVAPPPQPADGRALLSPWGFGLTAVGSRDLDPGTKNFDLEQDLSDGTQSTLVTLIVFAGAAVMPALLRHAGITSWGVPTLAGIAHWTVTCRYGMQRLKLICEDRLCRHMDVCTVATTLALAHQHGCRGLKEACCEFLKSSKTLDAVMATDGFQHLVKSCPSVLFELMSKLASH
ncbi:hypothetical protein BDA96_01G260400 [Sorghum bicolor]|uniref:BTB domain-containing protein n=1 Tax=Sorghum bicolor TaxID=4558 RepID=A0A921RZW7_SORBI|nr:hypothetical protein BDA96_01G260400 [Sorghum bicolor]